MPWAPSRVDICAHYKSLLLLLLLLLLLHVCAIFRQLITMMGEAQRISPWSCILPQGDEIVSWMIYGPDEQEVIMISVLGTSLVETCAIQYSLQFDSMTITQCRERFNLKISHSKSAMQENNLRSKIIFCIAICEFCIANLKYLKLQYVKVQVLFLKTLLLFGSS